MLKMSKTKKFLSVSGILSLFPFAALAADPGTVEGILGSLSGTFSTIISLLFVVATVIFLWGVTSYIAKGDDDAAKKKAKSLMTWGIIGMAVMASAWGISKILTGYFGVGGDQAIPKPFSGTVNAPPNNNNNNNNVADDGTVCAPSEKVNPSPPPSCIPKESP